jgi:hypothetical protein
VDVDSESDVIGQIPAQVVGIVVEDDVIVCPVPIVAITYIIRKDAEVVSAEPKTGGASTFKTPDVTTADGGGEAAVLPRMIEMEAGIVAAGVMTDPCAVGMNVGGFGMSLVIAKRLAIFGLGGGGVGFLFGSTLHGALRRLRAAAGNIASANARMSAAGRGGLGGMTASTAVFVLSEG